MRFPGPLIGAALAAVLSAGTAAVPAAGGAASPPVGPRATKVSFLVSSLRAVPSLVGTWRTWAAGYLLPPGLSPFEAIRSALRLAPDGGFTLIVDTPTGTFQQEGRYTAEDGRLTLTFPSGAASYGFSRAGDRLILRSSEKGATGSLTLLPSGRAPASGGLKPPAVAAPEHGPIRQRPNTSQR